MDEKVPVEHKVAIRLRRQAGRVTEWVVGCEECGDITHSGSKKGATQGAIRHADEVHGRYVRIHVPV